MKGYKGFNKDLKCQEHQFEIGKEYEHKGEVKLCSSGYHFCLNPLHVLRYYNPAESRFTEIEADGVSEGQEGSDSKRACKSIKIGLEISLKQLIEAGIKFVFEKVDWSKAAAQTHGYYSAAQTHGNYSAAQTHGYYSAAQTHGNYSAAQTHGNYSAAQTHGDSSAAQTHGNYSAAQTHGNSSAAQTHGDSSAAQTHCNSSAAQTHGDSSAAVAFGINSKASGALGNWITLDEWKKNKSGIYERVDVKTVKVDGEKIKADTFYGLEDGKFVEKK